MYEYFQGIHSGNEIYDFHLCHKNRVENFRILCGRAADHDTAISPA